MTQDEKPMTNKGLFILKKMGFRERIGRFEDGILQPISAEGISGRQGLGYNTNQQSTLRNSNTISPESMEGWSCENGIDNSKYKKSCSVSVFTKRKRLEKTVIQESEISSSSPSESIQEARRRGILVDLDVLIENHKIRKMQALKETIDSFFGTEYDLNSLQWFLEDEESDWALIQKVIWFLYSKLLDEDEMSSFYEMFESILMKQPLERNAKAQQLCERLSEKPLLRVGILHKGSRKRMNEEMRMLSIRELQMCKYALALDIFAQVPYNEQWNELCRRIGVHPKDCYALLVAHRSCYDRPSQLEVGSILSGISPIRWNSIDNSMNHALDQTVLFRSVDLLELFTSKTALRDNSEYPIFENVLARFSSDGLWYFAKATRLNESKYYWVIYKGWGNSELREQKDIEIVPHHIEEILKANNYRGLNTHQKQQMVQSISKY